jgi:hypothetical protein
MSPSPEDETENENENENELYPTTVTTKNQDQDDDPEEEEEIRSLELRNLPTHTTHLDLTNAIRGGALLEIYLRHTDHCARITFVSPASAHHFLARSKRVGFVVGNRRVPSSFFLPTTKN